MPFIPSTSTINSALGLISTGTPHLALYTTNPTASDTGTELTGGSYARQPITFGAVSGAEISNTTVITFTGVPTANITHYGIKGGLTSGNLRGFGTLNSTAAVVSGDQVQFPVGSIKVNVSGV